ncbi:MAG: hypothetical protein AW09_001747 [Candidatus Accumulibacter phosphatis]|uniref:Acyltransferase 3 domain-containing protein n=1 Tax=Candidatus Accumulibacter phosphatis TaxID=327160 RepID=A0A080M7E5_9PROT|nr:MAG: hypothetical protein AW09_001747 [Candidatus Accumulibacter phosphatis]
MVFGAYTLLSGYSRQIVMLLACLAAGPRIIFTMPVWLLGVVAYRLDQKTHLHRSSACVLFAISGLGIALYMTTFGHSVLQSLNDAIFGGSHSRYWTLGGHTLFLGDLPKLPADILLGILFATAIVTVKPAMEGLHPPVWISSSIRYLAGSTFSLYLFHAPLLYFIAANMHLQKHSAFSVILLGVLVFLTCFALSYPTERQVGRYRAFFLDLISMASRVYQGFHARMK